MITDGAIEQSGQKLDESNTAAEVLAVVAAFNAEVGPEGIAVGIRASVFEKIEDWLKKLVDKLKDLVGKHEAQSFTITVGLHVSVSITIAATAT